MSCVNTAFSTTGVQLAATAVELLPFNIHRKGLMLHAKAAPVDYAFGEAPGVNDYITLASGATQIFDDLIPAQSLWVKGTGFLVYGEAK